VQWLEILHPGTNQCRVALVFRVMSFVPGFGDPEDELVVVFGLMSYGET
jgi:hypothetical protein